MSPAVRVLLPPTGHLADANTRIQHPADLGAWVWHPEKGATETAILRFRLSFRLERDANPRLHVTADQRFQLRCDGRDVTFGPDRCDLEHWTVQTIDLPLAAGEHELEALCWYIAEPVNDLPDDGVRPPMAQITWRGGFLVYAENTDGLLLDTGKAPWIVEDLTDAVALERPRVPGYHDVGPSFGYDLTRWQAGVPQPAAVVRPLLVPNENGVRRPGWCLYPAALPEQHREPWTGGRMRAFRSGGDEAPFTASESNAPELADWQGLIGADRSLTVPPSRSVTILWDLEDYHCGYPSVEISGGNGATLEWSWAEALYGEQTPDDVTDKSAKGHRGEIVSKVFVGIGDHWRIGLSATANLPALWWRCGRYVRLRVYTAGEPLTLARLGIVTTGFPLGAAGEWRSSDAQWDRLMTLFERAFRCAGHETWTDTPYYEQMCYVGDNILTALANYAWFDDARLSRRSVQLFEWSRRHSGFVAERYPSGWRQECLPFSLLWPAMVRDFAWWQDDPAFVRSMLPGVRGMLAEFDALAEDDGLLGTLPGWTFADWVPEWRSGYPPGAREGDSSIVNLQWVLAHLAAAQVERACGDDLLAVRSERMAREIFARVLARYWDGERGLLLDSAGSDALSEHAQTFALLTGLLDPGRSRACLNALRTAPGLARATIYGSFYVLEALYQQGESNEFYHRLEPWRDLPNLGFTSTPEQPEPTRSDAHAWGAHPAWHALASMAGVRPAAPGFARVRVAPLPGPLEKIACSVAHPRGRIGVDLRFDAGGGVRGTLRLPTETTGEFVWRDAAEPLHAGENRIAVPSSL